MGSVLAREGSDEIHDQVAAVLNSQRQETF